MAESILSLAAAAAFGWLGARLNADYSIARQRNEEAKAIAAGLWAEMAVYRKLNEDRRIPDAYRKLCRQWIGTGRIPNSEYYAKAFDYTVADAYPYFASVMSKIGVLGPPLAAKIADFHARERQLLAIVLENIHTPSVDLETSKATAALVLKEYEFFLMMQDNAIRELLQFSSRRSWWSKLRRDKTTPHLQMLGMRPDHAPAPTASPHED